jgi:hypothetical protein
VCSSDLSTKPAEIVADHVRFFHSFTRCLNKNDVIGCGLMDGGKCATCGESRSGPENKEFIWGVDQ